MILLKEFSGVAFRNDILRGVRLFMIAFSAVLVGIWVYRMLRTPSDVPSNVQAAVQNAPAPVQPEQEPATAAAPVTEASSEPHGLVVPEPPPVPGTRAPIRVTPHPRNKEVPPPPPPVAVRSSRPRAPSGREFEASVPGVLPAAPTEKSSDASPVPTNKVVGYKSLLEANANRLPVNPVAQAPVEEPAEKPRVEKPQVEKPQVEKPQKGNRFFRAIGKILHPGQKETMPLTLQPEQQ